jgi:hypothetical protein
MTGNQETFQQKLDNFGFDYFAGKAVFENGREILTILNLKNGIDEGYSSLDMWLEKFSKIAGNGEKILLSRSPGDTGKESYDSGKLLELTLSALKCKGANIPPEYVQRVERHKGETHTLLGRKYVPLNEEEMEELKTLYRVAGKRGIRNPFENQPKAVS